MGRGLTLIVSETVLKQVLYVRFISGLWSIIHLVTDLRGVHLPGVLSVSSSTTLVKILMF